MNYKNALGTQGRLVKAYSKLMTEMWVDKDGRTAPWDVKKAIGAVAQQFQGFAQQDSYELFNYLVDTLHEDLNRVIEKPYIESKDSDGRPDAVVSQEHWEAYTARNKSVIVDLMYGQLKSRLTCFTCGSVSNTFDPFLALSVPIPKPSKKRISVTVFPEILNPKRYAKTIQIDLTKSDNGASVKQKIQDQYGIPEDKNLHVMYTS